MKTIKYTLTSILFLSYINTAFTQCYDLNVESVTIGQVPMIVDMPIPVTYEICNTGVDPIPVDANGGVRINICPSVNNLLQVSTFTTPSFFSFSSFFNCSIAEQTGTIPLGCFTFEVEYQATVISEIGEYTGNGENTGTHCIQTNIVPSGILIANTCNDTDNDLNHVCTYSFVEPLEVDLINFQVKQSSRTAILNWATASEINNDYFAIEHSVDGLAFEVVGKVDGNGTTDKKVDYSFSHQTPNTGINYYRLQQLDFNGEYSYSEIRQLNFKGRAAQLNIFPNPAVDLIQLEGVKAGYSLEVYNLLGKQVLKKTLNDVSQLSVTNFAKGVHVFKVLDHNGMPIFTDKILISK